MSFPPSPFWMQGNMSNMDDPGLSVDPNFTTVMLRNIPNKYTTKMLLDVLDKRFAKQYDYVYLPVDFVNHCNVGYAFINLRSADLRARFYRHFHNQKVKEMLPGFNSKKVLKQVCEVNKAKVQGAKENIRRIRQMNMLMTRLKDHPDWVPLLFDQEGTAVPLDLDASPETVERTTAEIISRPQPKKLPFYGGMWDGGMGAAGMGAAGMGYGAYPPMYNIDPFSQHMFLQQQAQAAYNVAVASATAAAVSASNSSSPSDYMMSPTDSVWGYGANKENSSNQMTNNWGQQVPVLGGMAHSLNKMNGPPMNMSAPGLGAPMGKWDNEGDYYKYQAQFQ